MGWRLYAWFAAAAVAAGLVVASAGGVGLNVQFGVGAAKGCNSPTFVGQPYTCFYAFTNVTPVGPGNVPSKDTVLLTSATDVVTSPGGATTSSGNILSQLQLIFSSQNGAPLPTCTGGSGLGTILSPYINATSCQLPYDSTITTMTFSFYKVLPGDFVQDPGQPVGTGLSLDDQMSFLWQDQCDVGGALPGVPCDKNIVNKVQAPSSTVVRAYVPTITTLLSSSLIGIGGTVHDTAQITFNVVPPTVSGTVTYKLFTDNTCTTASTNPSLNQTVAYSGGAVPNSQDVTFPAAGHFWFQATFSGDPAHGVLGAISPCTSEPLTVAPNQPALDTLASAGGAAPAALTDTATLSGASANATGTITFHLFSDANCNNEVAGSPVTKAVNGNGQYTSPAITVQNVGTYFWRDSYSGDANNNAVGLTACGIKSESATVTQAKPGLTTNASAGGQVTVTVTDTAHLTGATANATGTITFHLYSDSGCATEVSGSPVTVTTVNGPGDYTSPGISLSAAGTYFWRAAYSGDANNAAITLTACGAPNESVTTTPGGGGGGGGTPAIGITKNPKTQTIPSGSTASWTIVVTNTGQLTLNNVTVSDPLAPGCNRTSADIPALASMAPGASVTYNCSLANVTASFTNVATDTGTATNGQTVTATDTAQVTVTPPFVPPPTTPTTPTPTPKPAIDIIKDPNSQTIGQGGTADFKITVTNSGNVTLTDVTVTDPLSPDCDRNLGTLAVGQSKSYTCSRKNVTAAFENVATATGKPPTGAQVKANDNANVQVKAFVPPQHPKIGIVKSPKHQTVITQTTTDANGTTTVAYGDAHFTIKVTNTGDVPLHSVTVTDPQSPDCNQDLGDLAVGQSKTYDCTRAKVTSDFTNVATATGLSPKNQKVTAQDHANVTVKVKTSNNSGAKFTG
jgi:uncharacterized repeat protein (TIGR01451 family)